MPKKLDLIGQKFGYLIVIEEAGRDNGRNVLWKCRCDCSGKEVIVYGTCLKNGQTKSCGCLQREKIKEKSTKHGKRKSPIYKVWINIRQRCYNPNNQDYRYYGGRGIKVCERWHKFENFYEDMGDIYKNGLTIERINNDGHYEPKNCKWVIPSKQQWNKRCRGYYWDACSQKWQARIMKNNKPIFLGLFTYEEDARKAYVEAKKKYHGVYLDK